jgi:hypothetical protein
MNPGYHSITTSEEPLSSGITHIFPGVTIRTDREGGGVF